MTTNNEFGTLESRDIREYWEHEEREFTPWLADNIQHLEDTLNLELEVEDTERDIGRYFLDILAQEVDGRRTVVIENQLGDSDHDHLGKLLAYAAGVDADVAVWISPEFHDEHTDAVGWLNENSKREIDLFAVRLEIWEIGDSKPAVRLNPVEKPSEWKDRVDLDPDEELSALGETRLEYWTEFRNKIKESETILRPRKPKPNYWYNNPIGKSGFAISFHVNKSFSVGSNPNENKLKSNLLIRDDAEAFEKLSADRDSIEESLGSDAVWIPPEETRGEGDRSYITLEREGDISNRNNWDRYHDWMLKKGELLHETFHDRVQQL